MQHQPDDENEKGVCLLIVSLVSSSTHYRGEASM